MSDLIYKQEAIEACKHAWAKGLEPSQYIEILPPAQPEQRWIPCGERLPEDGKWCLFTDGVNMSVERYKADAMDHFFPEGRWFSLEDAVAWMPLPEPYKED